MSLAPPPFQAWSAMPSVWQRWFQALFLRIGGSNIDLLAPLASPVFTGNPRAPTPAVDDNDTSVATTAFVLGQAASASPAMDGAAAAGASARYARADHVHPSDTSRAPLASPTFTGTATAPTFSATSSGSNFPAEAWAAPTLLNSWANYGSGYSDAGYYKDATGSVRLQGAIKSGTIGATAFTLPAGSRPLASQAYSVPTGAGLATYGAVVVAADGTVSVTVGDNALVHLAGISFRAEQ